MQPCAPHCFHCRNSIGSWAGADVIAGHIPLRVAKMEDADVIACHDNGDEVSSSLPALCVCVRVGDEGARRFDA